MTIRNLSQKVLLEIIVILFFAITFLNAQSIIQTIPLPNTTYWNQAYGICGDGTSLFVSSGTSTTTVYNYGRIYKLDYNGNIIDSVNSTTITFGQSQGLGYDEASNFYYVKRYTASCTIIKSSPIGVIIDSLRSTRYIGDVVWDGNYLWATQYYPNPGRVLKVDWNTKSIVDSFWTYGDQPTGIAWDGNYLYYAMDIFSPEPNLNLIYVYDPVKRDTVKTIAMPEAPTTDSNPRGLGYDGEYLWLIARPVGGPTTRQVLYKYDLGGGGTPAINIPTKFFDNGWVNLGDSVEVTATIQSIGTAALRLDSVKLLFSSNYFHNLVTPQTIPAGSSHNFNIKFKPIVYGVDSAHVVIYHNDITRPPQAIRLTGKGQYTYAYISTPASYDFGMRRVNSTSSWQLKIENHGTQSLTVSSGSFGTANFYIESNSLPATIAPVSSKNIRVWFFPKSAGLFNDSLTLVNNSLNSPSAKIALSGTGDATPLALGVPFWNYTVPDHPVSNTSRTVKGIRAISDISEDGKPDVIICTENYWTMAVSGNSSVVNDSLWAFNTYISSSSAGSIGTTGDYSYQKALAIASDLNGDGFNDVVIGTGGGNETVYAINGKTGAMLWKYGTDDPGSYSLGDFTGVDVSKDYNNDGVPDVIAAAAATESGGIGGRRSVYLFNGVNGNIIWQAPLLGFTHAVAAIRDINNDGIPDVIGTVGEAAYKATAFSGANGNIIWDFPVPSASGGGKEILILPVSSTQEDVILGAFWGPIYRINSITGAQVWSTPTGNQGVLQFGRLKDIDKDGIDEIVVATLGGGAMCLNGANGNIIWNISTGNTMGIAVIPDLNGDGYDDVVVASQPQGTLIVKGNNGFLLAQHTFGGSLQTREVAIVPDLDGNNSLEILAGSNQGHVVLLSGGLDAPVKVDEQNFIPVNYSLMQNYPNPFNPVTNIKFALPVQSKVSIEIFNLLGQKVRTLLSEDRSAGYHIIEWNGLNDFGKYVGSGVYYVKISADGNSGKNFTQVRKMIFLR